MPDGRLDAKNDQLIPDRVLTETRRVADERQENGGGAGDAAGPLGDILDTFRHRISEAQGDDAIAEQHYLLGVACGRAGRYDEAKGPLEAASESPRHCFSAAALLGRICRDEGNPADAVEWFERAAAVTAPTPDEGWTLLYHLGTTLDRMDESARALAVFLELQGTAGEYRDVGERVGRLTETLLGG